MTTIRWRFCSTSLRFLVERCVSTKRNGRQERRLLYLFWPRHCRAGAANSPSILEGVPVGRGSNIGIRIPYSILEGVPVGRGSNIGSSVSCDRQRPDGLCSPPTPAFGHPFPREGELASAAAARSGQEKFIQGPTTCAIRLVSFRLPKHAKVELRIWKTRKFRDWPTSMNNVQCTMYN